MTTSHSLPDPGLPTPPPEDCAPAAPVSRLAVWRTRIDYQGALLGAICAAVTLSLLIADTNTITAIADRQMEDRLANLAQVMPPTLYDNNPLTDAIQVSDPEMGSQPVTVYPARKQGQLTALAFQTSSNGYGGPIALMVGVDKDGNILGVRVLSHKETPGLADKIELGKSNWITRFNGLSLTNTSKTEWAVKKDGGKIDQFTGATITPRAVVKGIHGGLEFISRHAQEFRRASCGPTDREFIMSHVGCQGCGAASAPETTGSGYRQSFTAGLWENNISLVQMLGMCPTMAVTGTATNGLGMGLATTAVMMLSNLLISLMRNTISPEVRNPVMIAVIAGMVTLVDMAMNAWMHEMYKVLGLFIALIVTNCAVLGRTEAFALRNGPVASVLDGLGMGLGFTWALTLLGGIREVLGSGTLFASASNLLGPHFHWLEITLMPADKGILLAILPPGGFIVLGAMIAMKRIVDRRLTARRKAAADKEPPATLESQAVGGAP